MSTYTEAATSWKSLIGCFGTGLLALALIGGGVWFFLQKSRSMEARIEREFLQPWFTAARDGKTDAAWETLTTGSYRAKNAKDAVAATYRQAEEKLGPPQSAVINKATGAKELLSDRPGYQLVGTKWLFDGKEVFLVFELIDVPGQGFRVDHARLGFTRKTGLSGGYTPPKGTPEGPW